MLRLRLLEQALHIMQNQDYPCFLCFFDCKYCPYERGIILHHDHCLTIIIQIPISQVCVFEVNGIEMYKLILDI